MQDVPYILEAQKLVLGEDIAPVATSKDCDFIPAHLLHGVDFVVFKLHTRVINSRSRLGTMYMAR
jgi:hypothetical protein